MNGSQKNIEITQLHCLLALTGLKQWPVYREKLADDGLTKCHLIVIVDEPNFSVPKDVIVMRSAIGLLNVEFLGALLENYKGT